MNDQPNADSSHTTPPSQPPVTPGTGAKEVTDKAMELAKDGVATLKKLDLPAQIYLGGLAVAFLCSIFFDVISIKMKLPPGMPDIGLMGGFPKSFGSYSAFEVGSGKLAALAALAGIGLWIWNFRSSKKESWVPKALAGVAGFSALMFLVLMVRSSPSPSLEMVEVNVSMTLLGFWLPFAGAIVSTVIAVRQLKAAA
jgi:hypothetical protein